MKEKLRNKFIASINSNPQLIQYKLIKDSRVLFGIPFHVIDLGMMTGFFVASLIFDGFLRIIFAGFSMWFCLAIFVDKRLYDKRK